MGRSLIVGNWKMNGLAAALPEIAAMAAARDDLWLAPPFTLIGAAVAAAGGRVAIGGQDCHASASGAHTGCVSAPMLADLGAGFVIVGHSERRTDMHETDADVRAKALAGQAAGLQVIVCVGESEVQRDAGAVEAVVGGQLAGSLPDDVAGVIVAYEPVWAIGTGRTPTPAEVAAVHGFIRARLVARFGAAGQGVRILYGGSVKPDNAALLLGQADVGGALVGGASLTAASLLAIAAAAE
ncbi:triose-phosphate isomerase [Polymorphobacter fuscus]|uniref:Triosephosphate isomerase n=1 Tax=Sandarakinorhabdus fusca TaxID=1439888 RepID=A0A7C9KGS5_9SPHN|nr:triose-phosphate isomerase [Polymorphobacter fuscus]KAB7648768.1 triose-phosphate isomerase [Polymorphobacter fuscus]MQT16340.1 triose-phosphate isomerase [Polymorphobacter fuscus]NJC07372.1 triosephosphate isomerase [Polymorphobacter fuscus]